MNEWDDAQEWEVGWWADCTNTFAEETKQISYAHRMGLTIVQGAGRWPYYDLAGKSVLDLGGGPVSLLLKTFNGGLRTVVDPGAYPDWIATRYAAAGIDYLRQPAEGFVALPHDECWIYNVLQHVKDPCAVIAAARAAAPLIRIFEWIDLPAYDGHLHELKAAELDRWLAGSGHIAQMNENGAKGRAYYGVFS